MKMYMQNYQYKHWIKSTSNWLNLSKIEYMSYFDLFQAILWEYQDLQEYKKSKFYSALESRIWTINYNKRFDKMKSFEKILEAIPVEIFDIYREILIPRCVNHYLNEEKLFNDICEKFSISQDEIQLAQEIIKKSHETRKIQLKKLEIDHQQSIVKKQINKITNWKTLFQLIIEHSHWVSQDNWISQSKIRWNIDWLNSQEYINKSIELIFNFNQDYVYKNTQVSSNGTYLISPDLLEFITVIYKLLRDELSFINQNDITSYLIEKNISLEEYILENYSKNNNIIKKDKKNILWIIKILYTLELK